MDIDRFSCVGIKGIRILQGVPTKFQIFEVDIGRLYFWIILGHPGQFGLFGQIWSTMALFCKQLFRTHSILRIQRIGERAISQNKQVKHAKGTSISTIPICSSCNYHKCLLLGLDWWWVSKKGERLHMVGKRDRLAELLLSQSSEIGLALPPTNQAQSFTQLYHVIDPRHFWVQHISLTLDEWNIYNLNTGKWIPPSFPRVWECWLTKGFWQFWLGMKKGSGSFGRVWITSDRVTFIEIQQRYPNATKAKVAENPSKKFRLLII